MAFSVLILLLQSIILTKCNGYGIIPITNFRKVVSIIRYSGTPYLFACLEASARSEESELPKGKFVARYCKSYKKLMAIMSGIAIAIGGTLMFFWDVAILFLLLGLCLLSLLPTFLSYKCLINKELMEEEYFILLFKKKKTIYWRDVKYKKVKTNGRNKSITLYDAHKKRLIAFDELIVGFERVVKLAKQSRIKNLPRN